MSRASIIFPKTMTVRSHLHFVFSLYLSRYIFYFVLFPFFVICFVPRLYCSPRFPSGIRSKVPKSIRYAAVAPVCKYVLNSSGGWRHQNATPPPFNVPEEVHGALKHETISLVCEVEASPTNVTFHWTFNSSGDLSDIPSTNYTNEGTTSKLNYTPVTDTDYGVLGCWASNSVGSSKQPCLYQVIAAGSYEFSPLFLFFFFWF